MHKSGVKQLSNYIEFIKQLQEQVTNPESVDDIQDCVVFVYEQLCSTVYSRCVSPEEFMTEAQKYFRRVESVWEWQTERGPHHHSSFRASAAVKANNAYR